MLAGVARQERFYDDYPADGSFFSQSALSRPPWRTNPTVPHTQHQKPKQHDKTHTAYRPKGVSTEASPQSVAAVSGWGYFDARLGLGQKK